MSQTISLKFNQNYFSEFLEKFSDLTTIDDVIKIKIDENEVLMYSLISSESSIVAFKGYELKTEDLFENYTITHPLDFIITSSNKLSKNLKFFNPNVPIDLQIIIKKTDDDDDERYQIRSAQFKNGKLKITCISGEQFKIKDLKKSILNQKLNPKKSKWNFKVTSLDFTNIKKLSTINNENKTFNITVQSGKVLFGELSKWELEVDQIQSQNTSIIFNKKYLGNINEQQEINFHIFENFILIKDNNSNLMLSFEQNFSEDD